MKQSITSKYSTMNSSERRIAGSLIGLAIGDAFGDAARDADNHFNYGITMDFTEKSTGSTDDTEFALLTAKILLDSKGEVTNEAVVRAWREHVIVQDTFNRGGASEREAAVNLHRGIMPPESGMYNAYNNSDGAAMRIAPIGMICPGNPEKAAAMAIIDSQISHYREGIWGAQAVAAAAAAAMVQEKPLKIYETARKYAPDDSWFAYTLDSALALIEKADYRLEKAWMPLHKMLRSEYKAAVPEAVTSALAVFLLTGGDFESGIIYAGNFGRDSDTIGAVVGALAGAYNGIDAIPEDWVEQCRYPSGTCLYFTKGMDVLDMASDLAKLIK